MKVPVVGSWSGDGARDAWDTGNTKNRDQHPLGPRFQVCVILGMIIILSL